MNSGINGNSSSVRSGPDKEFNEPNRHGANTAADTLCLSTFLQNYSITQDDASASTKSTQIPWLPNLN